MWNSEAEKGKTYEESVKDSVAGELEAMALCDAHKKDYDVALTDEEKASIKKAAKSFSEDNGLEQKEKVSGQEKTVEKVFTMMLVSSKVRTAIEAGADTEVSDEEAAQKKMQYVLFSNTKTCLLYTSEPTVQEIASEIGISKEDIVFALDAIQVPMSLQEPVYNDGGDALYVMDQISDTKNKEERWVENLSLEAAMGHLNPRERHIIKLRFFEGKTQMEVAGEIKISQAQVSRLEKNALRIMRQYLS